MRIVALSSNGYWALALGLGAAAAVVVAILLLVLLIVSVGSIEKSVDGLLEIAGKVGANTANIPQLEATAPVLALIVDEAVVQDGYMNALTDGFGRHERHAPPRPPDGRAGRRRRARARSRADPRAQGPRRGSPPGSRRCRRALQGVESEHLRPLEGAVTAINGQFDIILGALPGIASKAAIVAERRPR